ncbi:MAG: nucleotidyltransferase family protein [Dehalococcoidales bacterium]|nr:nucleotidyltransferase family protein [Dehalococcoidales bacterium]
MVTINKRENNIAELKNSILPILSRHQVARAGIFGSVADGTSTDSSDLDLLIRFKNETSLFDFVSLKMDLESVLERKVDLVTYNSVHPLIKKKVMAQEIRIL